MHYKIKLLQIKYYSIISLVLESKKCDKILQFF
jgi:hypothetical protein